MKNRNKRNENASGASGNKNGGKFPVTKLPRMEMYAVLGLELSKTIFEKLEKVEGLIDILGRQKWRDLDSEKSPQKAENPSEPPVS